MVRSFREKRFDETLDGAKELVREWPELGFGWNLLAATHQALGEPRKAAAAFRQAVDLEPANPDAHNNLGNVLRELGEYEASVRMHERAIALSPGMLAAHYNLGLALAASGRHREASKAFEAVIRMRPDVPDAHNQLGNQLKAEGRLADAVAAYERALELAPEHVGVLNNLASAHSAMGRVEDAEKCYRRALQIDPNASDVLSNLGTFLMSRDRLNEAEGCYRKALEAQSASAELYNNLGVVLHKLGRVGEAETVLRRAVDLRPDSVTAWHNLGNVLMDAGRLDEAEGLHRRALELAPDSADAHRNLGVTLAVLGRPAEAEQAYRRALEIQPDRGEVYYRLAEVKRFEPDDPDLLRIEDLLGRDGLSANDRVYLHYAAGKACADAGANASSFRHYRAGASSRRAQFDYDVGADEAQFEGIADAFPVRTVARVMSGGHDSDVPVFVVGMPRSGTTLVENLLAAHARIHGAGERFDIDRLVAETSRSRGVDFPAWAAGLEDADWRRLGAQYAGNLAEVAPGAARIVDKMPNNFRYLGLIAGMLPNTRIIHVRREPADTCVSCFTHLFENEELFSYDLEELGRFYRAYSRLMDHWTAVLPGCFLMTVRYEDIIEEPERMARALIEHCGLEWDPACLAFAEGGRAGAVPRAVTTASLVQVRQPLYRSAIGRWRFYEDHLGPLLNALGDLAPGGDS